MDKDIRNAVIKSTSLGYEDHGIFVSYLNLEGDGWGVGFGGYGLDEYDRELNERVDRTGLGLEYIKKMLWVVGVEKWEELPGKHVRVEIEGIGWGSSVALGHVIKDIWFRPREWFETRLGEPKHERQD